MFGLRLLFCQPLTHPCSQRTSRAFWPIQTQSKLAAAISIRILLKCLCKGNLTQTADEPAFLAWKNPCTAPNITVADRDRAEIEENVPLQGMEDIKGVLLDPTTLIQIMPLAGDRLEG
ncbi:hypothetical protein [Bradyrhizobium sp. HKCCYLS20291]|uniref:hypothetical protein n=1 Tax=Bradyrhizobium sp. HKCCYLS20291 TaxID=3420766 RepID=UPI003EBECAF8